MQREEAQEALDLIREVVSKVHDETVLQNWGAVMIITGVLDLLAFGATQVLVDQGARTLPPYVLTWGIYLVASLGLNLAIRRRMGGSMTYVERHIWGNGVTFYVSAFCITAVNLSSLAVEDALVVIPAHLAVVGAVSFSFMALLDCRFFLYTALFFLVAGLLALWPAWGFAVLGVTWLVCLGIPGLQYLRARSRLLASGQITETV